MKYFVDTLQDDGQWHHGGIAWPREDAEIVAKGMKEEHPTWLVEINPLEGTP